MKNEEINKQLEGLINFEDISKIYKSLLIIYPDQALDIFTQLAKTLKEVKKIRRNAQAGI